MQLYMHGVHQDFLQLNNLSKLEAVSGGSAEALTKMEGDLEYYKVGAGAAFLLRGEKIKGKRKINQG